MRVLVWVVLVSLIVVRVVTTSSNYEDGTRVRITSSVSSEPLRFENSQRLSISGFKIYVDRYPEINYGDSVVVEGVVSDGNLEQVKLLSHTPTSGILQTTRKRMIAFYNKSLPSPHSSLVAGVALGSKSNQSTAFWDDLRKTGTAHVVVASGMNVTLVAGFLMSLLVTFLKRKQAVVATLTGIWIYTSIAGFEAPLVRAAIMGSLAFGAQGMGRISTSWRLLFLSAALMLVVKPEWLTDLGFILSFVATASLMLFERKVARLIRFAPGIFREGLSTSLAAQIGVAPILYFTFGQFNLLSPLINSLVLWTIAPITVIGGIAGIVSLVVPALGRLILLLIYPLTSWFIFIVGVF